MCDYEKIALVTFTGCIKKVMIEVKEMILLANTRESSCGQELFGKGKLKQLFHSVVASVIIKRSERTTSFISSNYEALIGLLLKKKFKGAIFKFRK